MSVLFHTNPTATAATMTARASDAALVGRYAP